MREGDPALNRREGSGSRVRGNRWASFLLLASLSALHTSPLEAQTRDYLSAPELLAIGAVSGGAALLGTRIAHFGPDKHSLWADPPGWEVRVSRWAGGEPRVGKRNFLDDFRGAALTPAVAGAVVIASDLAYPVEDGGKDAVQDLALMLSGLAAMKAVTDIVKGIVARPRPLTHLAPEMAKDEFPDDPAFPMRSFFSGHAASAFFSATYLEHHARATLRRELSAEDYRSWRWAPPLVSYAWATVVGLSRIQAQRHYVTDVVAGAAAGVGMGLLFYSLGEADEKVGVPGQGGPPLLLTFSLSF